LRLSSMEVLHLGNSVVASQVVPQTTRCPEPTAKPSFAVGSWAT